MLTKKKRDGKSHTVRNVILSVGSFAVVFGCFLFGFGWISGRSDSEQEEILRKAIQNGITECYALEGFYPENLEYLEENYGISYNKDRFFVGYQPRGQNLMPDVTIIVKSAS